MLFNGTMEHKLDEFFPEPSLPPSQLSPQRWPGANLESLAALRDVLKENHQRHHIFFDPKPLHNHVTHRALAIYVLGGPAAIIRDYYKRDSHIQRLAFESPERITENNFIDHLGDENFYQSYVTFFSQQFSEKGAARTLEEFVFSEKYNFQKGRDANTQPEVCSRLYNGLMHPLIHMGYGLEFGLKGMFVEGLAMAVVHKVDIRTYSSPIFAPVSTTSVDYDANRLWPLVLDSLVVTGTPIVSKADGMHAFDLAARVLQDDRLKSKAYTDFDNQFTTFPHKYSPMIKEYAEQWTIDLNRPGEIERKMEEVTWLSSLIYGVGGLTSDGHQSDLYLMHLVTSSLFLPSIIAYITPRSQVILLRGYLFTLLAWWVIRGRPALNIKSFMMTTSLEPSVPTTPAPKTPLTTETTPTPNPFLPIFQSAITHPIDHLIKIQRAFAHCDTLYGRRPAGYFKGTELEDAELLDGSLFLRAALLTADSTGWAREGQEGRQFSFDGFYT